MFITYKISERVLNKYKRKLYILKKVYKNKGYKNKELKIPERYREEVKSYLSMRMDGAELSIDRVSWELKRQEEVKYDEDIVLKSKEIRTKPLDFEDMLSGRYLRGMSDLEHEYSWSMLSCLF